MKISFYSSDREIVEAIKSGDRKALAYFYKKYYPMIKQFVLQNSGTVTEAEDLYQEGILDVYENIVNGRYSQQSAAFKTYVYSVCRYKWLDNLRKRNNYPSAINDLYIGFIEIKNVNEESEDVPYKDILEKALSEVGDKCKGIIKDFYYHKMSMEQIATRNNFTGANVAKSTKERCMKKAREIANQILEQYHKK